MCFRKKPKPKISVSVCNDWADVPGWGARLANEYCPFHPAQYLKGQEPTLVCDKHVKPEPPPIIKTCKIPYHETGKLLCFSGNLLCTLSTKEAATFKEADLPTYFDRLVERGINSFRSFSAFYDTSPGWDSWRPDIDGDVYYERLHRRLKWATERKLTVILSIMPYGGIYDNATLARIINETWPTYSPHIIYEPWNENGNLVDNGKIIDMLKTHGVPNKHIQIYFQDSGDWAAYLQANPGMISVDHGVGSMATVNKWWEGSPGCHGLMALGFYASDDGQDMEKDSHGLAFFGNEKTRKPDNGQLYEITKFMLEHTTGFDHLSAAGFQLGGVPDLGSEMNIGAGEMDALAAAWHDVFGDCN